MLRPKPVRYVAHPKPKEKEIEITRDDIVIACTMLGFFSHLKLVSEDVSSLRNTGKNKGLI